MEKPSKIAGQGATILGISRDLRNRSSARRAPKEFEFPDPEAVGVRSALQTWEPFASGSDRRWLEPLVEALFSSDIGKA
jgi:virulence-associated protein VagC